jgi:hypothetical protein
MKLARIKELIHTCETEDLAMSELVEINEAFDELIRSGVSLSDEPDNAMALDMLHELEHHSTELREAH